MSSTREKELARLRAERQAARREQDAVQRRQRNAVLAGGGAIALVIAVVAFLVLSGDDEPEDSLAADPSSTFEPVSGTCTYSPAGEASRAVTTPPPAEPLTGPASVLLATSQGEITLELAVDAAPCTTSSFRTLVEGGFYDDTPCHRLTSGGLNVLQCGDPTGTGTGGPGFAYADENLEGATYGRGTVAMANSGPGTNGSQFFLVYADSQLTPDYTPFGTLDEASLQVLETIAAAGVEGGGSDGSPATPVQIEDASLT